VGLCLSIGLCAGGRQTLVVLALLIYLFDGDGAGIFRGLYHLTGNADHGLAIGVLVGGILIDLVHQPDRVLVGVVGVGLGSLGLCDAQGIARFKEFQWQPGVQNYGIEFVASGDIAAAFQKFILRVHRLGGSLGILADDVLDHDHVTWLSNRIVRFCRDHQSEGLKICRDVHLAAMVI